MDTAAWSSDSDLLLLLPELTHGPRPCKQPSACSRAGRIGSPDRRGVLSERWAERGSLIAAAISAAHSGQPRPTDHR